MKQTPQKKIQTETPYGDDPDMGSSTETVDNEWTLVNRNKKKTVRPRKPKQDTMIITAQEDISYAEILRSDLIPGLKN